MKKLLGATLGVLVAVMAGCSKSEDAKGPGVCVPASQLNGIISGYKVSSQDELAKKVVMLLMEGEKSSICTGTPIAKDVILTAAHCVKGATRVRAIFHTDITCESGFNINDHAIESSSFFYHDKYSGKTDATNDVALVKLKSAIPSDYDISKVYDGYSSLSSDTVTFAGYGVTREATEEGVPSGEGFLRMTTKSYRSEVRKDGMNLVIDQPYTGVCSGDSGGPIFVEVRGEKQIIGVNSVVSGPTQSRVCHGKAVAMYAPHFTDWIRTALYYLY